MENAVEVGSAEVSGRRIAQVVLAALFAAEGGTAPLLAGATSHDLLDLVKVHPFTRALAAAADSAASLDGLVEAVLPSYSTDEVSRALAERMLLLWAAVLSHVRKEVGRDALSVDLHLWVRELSRIDRSASAAPDYRWSDDRHLSAGPEAGTAGVPAFPAIYCRHCGRSGWAVQRAPVGGFDLTGADADDVRRARMADDREFRALLHAPAEAENGVETPTDPDEPRLLWLHAEQRKVLTDLPTDGPALAEGRLLPVLAHVGPEAGERSRTDVCPSCLQKDGIRFLGSAVATLMSVSLSTIFGSDDLDKGEKKTLVFTDSVQDAAHRAGFVQSRSHRLTLRAVLRGAVGDESVSLGLLVERAMEQAGDDPHRRYRLLPPDHADRDEFAPFWQKRRQRQVPLSVLRRVRKRLLLEAVLEMGLQSRLGRTLEMTGSLAAQVDGSRRDAAQGFPRGREGRRSRAPRRPRRRRRGPAAVGPRRAGADAHRRRRPARVVPPIPGRGRPAVLHLGRTSQRRRDDGLPPWSRGAGLPARRWRAGSEGQRPRQRRLLARWYAVWTARTLGCSPAEGASLAVELLKQLARLEVLAAGQHRLRRGPLYEIPQSRVLVEPVSAEASQREPSCSAATPAAPWCPAPDRW